MKALRSLPEAVPSTQSSQKKAARVTFSTEEATIHKHGATPVVLERGTYVSSNEAVTGLAVFDDHLRYVQINEALARLNGLSAEEHLGKTLHEIAPHIAPLLEPLLERIFETGEPTLNVEIKSERSNPPGPTRYWRLSFIPLPGNDGTPQTVSVMAVDITNRKLLKHPHADRLEASQAPSRLEGDVPLGRQIRVLRDVSAALSTAAEILEHAQTDAYSQPLDISRGVDFYEEVQRFEDALIRRALKLTGGNQKQAANLLRIKTTTLHTIIKRHHIKTDK
jgi:PAS domain S-box-containing protein